MRKHHWLKALENIGWGRKSRRSRIRKRELALHQLGEALEIRSLLTTTVFLDFGLGFTGGELNTKVNDLRSALGSADTGPDLEGQGSAATKLVAGDDLKFKPFHYDYNGDT